MAQQINTLTKVEREPYTGPVVQVGNDVAKNIIPDNPIQPTPTADNPSFHKCPTRSGNRSMQDSSFNLSESDHSGGLGEQIDDRNPRRSGTRVAQPPGGKASSLWNEIGAGPEVGEAVKPRLSTRVQQPPGGYSTPLW